MKKILILLGLIVLSVPFLYGQGTVTLPGMTEVTSIGPNDLLWVWLDPAGTNASRKIKASNLLARRGGCSMVFGNDDSSGDVLTDGQLGPQGYQCLVPQDATLLQITVAADGGTPSILLRRRRPNGGTTANLTSSALATASNGALACSKTTNATGLDGSTSCTNTLQNTGLSAGDWIESVSATAGGTARRMSVAITWTW